MPDAFLLHALVIAGCCCCDPHNNLLSPEGIRHHRVELLTVFLSTHCNPSMNTCLPVENLGLSGLDCVLQFLGGLVLNLAWGFLIKEYLLHVSADAIR